MRERSKPQASPGVGSAEPARVPGGRDGDGSRPERRAPAGDPPFHFILTDQDFTVLLRELIEHFPWHQVHPDLKVTMSMGVCADVGAGTAEAMLKKADVLLYQAKESGRNRVCFA
jgi:hypothetical protein